MSSSAALGRVQAPSAALSLPAPPRVLSPPVTGPAVQARLPEVAPLEALPRPAGPPTEPVPAAGELAAEVSPAGDPGQWLRTHRSSTLWSGPDDGAVRFTDLPQWSWLRILDGNPAGAVRLLVHYAGDGVARQLGPGWVDPVDVGRVGPPAPGELPSPPEQRPLPEWAQAHRPTQFWSAPEPDAVAFTDLPQWSYLQLQGPSRNGRLLAYYIGDHAARQPGLGWVDEAAVGPAGYPGRWLRNHRPSTLWSGPDEGAQRFSDLPQWSYLRILEGASSSSDRISVFYFGDGRNRHPGPAWISSSDVGPVAPPAPLPEPQRPGSWLPIQTLGAAEQRAFIELIAPAARASQRATRVPASVAIAQAILESNWGRSRLAREGNNLFGIKASGAPGSAGTITFRTWEHYGGRDVIVQAAFKAYASVEDSIRDHGAFFQRNPRYHRALAVAHDARAFAHGIHAAGYATDPEYAAKLIRLMDRFDLYRFDLMP